MVFSRSAAVGFDWSAAAAASMRRILKWDFERCTDAFL
jgi:hypothetical protein